MKIIKRIKETYEFDLEEERKRLKSCFKGNQLKRQEAILDAMFVEKNFEKASDLIDALPYCKEQECPEAEYVGAWVTIWSGMFSSLLVPVEEDRSYEIVLDEGV